MRDPTVKQRLWHLAKRVDATFPWLARGVRLVQSIGFDLTHPPFYPHGHFYSPVPRREEVMKRFGQLADSNRPLPGLDLGEERGRALLDQFAEFYAEIPWSPKPTEGLRYFFENDTYGYGDAIFLYSMLRYLQPKRYVEIGSGYSSCVAMDTIERFLNQETRCTFIEPNTGRLDQLLHTGDKSNYDVQACYVQDVDLAVFEQLEANDVLFVDGSHVSKVGSDVNHVVFEILPRLQPGVMVHFHDITHPFEYPKHALERNLWWNEAYLLRAFLTFNSAYRIEFHSTHLAGQYAQWLKQHMPLCLNNIGAALWIRRIG